MSGQHTQGPWKASTVKASKARAATRHWAIGPNRQRIGHFPTREAAEAEAAKRNAAIARATGSTS